MSDQNQYPGQPWNQPPPTPQQPAQAYGQAPHGQAPYGQAPYGQPYPPSPAAPVAKPSTLGIIGLILVVLAGIMVIWAGYTFGGLSGQLALEAGVQPGSTTSLDPEDPALQKFAGGMSTAAGAGILGGLLGLIGFIISIVAVAQRKGRTFGIAGIVLGVVFPIASFIALSMAMMPFASQLSP